ncbi:MAG: hypothetical protein EHM45_02875 [Desulfobacteraceae bacterium]|nr:MAG: hypothetical protein EHM45_02875 [Desulfobacteraceae bacterium]
MGAFLICPDRVSTPRALDIFVKKGFSEPKIIHLHSWSIYVYQKQWLEEPNYLETADSLFFSVGTVFYKGADYQAGLKLIREDFFKRTLDPDSLIGSFFIFVKNKDQIGFFTDRAAIQNVFYHRKTRVISSSFLAVLVASGEIDGKQPLNPKAVWEVLTTGNLIGPDTLIHTIERYEPAIHSDLMGIPPIEFPTPKINPEGESQSDPIQRQIDFLDQYFGQFGEVMNRYGVISGLTGGLDSRLLYLLFKPHVKHHQLHTTSQMAPTTEFRIALKFAQAAGEAIISPPHLSPEKTDQTKLLSFIRENFYFNDGLIRTHQVWLEEIKGKDYLKRLYGDLHIGFSGVGGEQYRNSQFLLRDRYRFRSWVWNELIFRYSGDAFSSSWERELFVEYLQKKIAELLGIEKTSAFITRYQIMRYFNEIWNPANRTMRNNIENQLTFFLSPFTDHGVSRRAYALVPYLRGGFDVEMEMIRRLAPELAQLETVYGFSPADRPSFLFQILPFVKRVLGLPLFNRLYYLRKRYSGHFLDLLLLKHPGLCPYIERVKALGMPLKIDRLAKNDFLAPLLIELGFFLTEMEESIDDT